MQSRQAPTPHIEFVRELGGLVRSLADADHGSEAHEYVAHSLRRLLDVDGFAVVNTADGLPLVVVADPPGLSELETGCGRAGPGPSFTAGRSKSVVVCGDLDTWGETRTAYVEAARAQQVRAVAALPLVARGSSFGALCLYCSSARAWSEHDLAVGGLFADLLACHLDHAAALEDQVRLTGQLQGALDSRVLIEQAKGVLAASEDIDVGTAFERIRNHARRTNTKIVTVASAVITNGLRPPPVEPVRRSGSLAS